MYRWVLRNARAIYGNGRQPNTVMDDPVPREQYQPEITTSNVLLMGPAGSGKTTLVKALRNEASGTDEEEVRARMEERKYLQYDLMKGVVKVMTRMMCYGERFTFEDYEIEAYNQGRHVLKEIQASGVVLTIDEVTQQENMEAGRVKNKLRKLEPQKLKRVTGVIPHTSDFWEILRGISQKEGFDEVLEETFVPTNRTELLTGAPLSVPDGFPLMLERYQTWDEVALGRRVISPVTSLHLRTPNGGLFTKSLVKAMRDCTDIDTEVSFLELPGRLESFVDMLSNLNHENGVIKAFNCVVLVFSYVDFDARKETDEGSVLVHRYFIDLLEEVRGTLGGLRVYLIMTKPKLFDRKIATYKNKNIYEKQLDDAELPWRDIEGRLNLKKLIKDEIIRRLEEIWSTVDSFPRHLIIDNQEQAADMLEMYEKMIRLSR